MSDTATPTAAFEAATTLMQLDAALQSRKFPEALDLLEKLPISGTMDKPVAAAAERILKGLPKDKEAAPRVWTILQRYFDEVAAQKSQIVFHYYTQLFLSTTIAIDKTLKRYKQLDVAVDKAICLAKADPDERSSERPGAEPWARHADQRVFEAGSKAAKAGRYKAALKAIAFAEEVGMKRWQMDLTQELAEAAFKNRDWDQAQQSAEALYAFDNRHNQVIALMAKIVAVREGVTTPVTPEAFAQKWATPHA